MRKIVMFNRMSLDGFFAGPDGEIDWFIHDPEIDKDSHENGESDMLLIGRLTYEMFAAYWPPIADDPDAPEGSRQLSRELNAMTKVVFSTTLDEATWENSRLLRGGLVEEVRRLKAGEGSDILIFGSGTLVQQLMDADLIDDYFVILTPVVAGAGKALFKAEQQVNLELLSAKSYSTGNVMLHYRPKPARN